MGLKCIMYRELTAGDVEPSRWLLISISQSYLEFKGRVIFKGHAAHSRTSQQSATMNSASNAGLLVRLLTILLLWYLSWHCFIDVSDMSS